MHHDEANQAVKFGALLERGQYRYDAHDHHGPTLYYLTLPAAWLRGQATLASLDERTLRGVTAVFGAGRSCCSCPWIAAASAAPRWPPRALLAAVSPALIYYSRFYIQESLFVFFAVGFLVALGRYAGARAAVAAALGVGGLFAGLAYATKETSVIVVGGGSGRVRPSWRSLRSRRATASEGLAVGRPCLASLALARRGAGGRVPVLLVVLQRPGGRRSSRSGPSPPTSSAVSIPASHAHPWDYYLRILAYSSSGGLVWTEAADPRAGAAAGMACSSRWPLARLLAALLWPLLADRARSSSRRSRTRRRGTCCRSTRGSC